MQNILKLIAVLFLSSSVVAGDYTTTKSSFYLSVSEVKELKRLAGNGDGVAAHKLALFYMHSKSDTEGYAKWMKASAETGLVEAQYNYGLYLKGQGDKAFSDWLLLASASGLNLATLELARAYENGDVVEKDSKESFKQYFLAAQRGSLSGIKKVVDSFYGQGEEEETYYWLLVYFVKHDRSELKDGKYLNMLAELERELNAKQLLNIIKSLLERKDLHGCDYRDISYCLKEVGR